jgi:transposase InsO family protein
MASSMPSFGLSLPKGWPKRVRSAVIHAISLAHVTLTTTRSWAANNWNARIRLKTENDRLRQEVALLEEEMRIKDDRMLGIPAHRRPRYSPIERLAILELRAARGWSLAQTARRLLLSTATIASWMHRLDERGSGALIQLREPVNRYPDFVRYIVKRLKVLCPSLGKAKLAQMMARAGLHLGTTTVGRFLKETPRDDPPQLAVMPGLKGVFSRGPNHTWLADLTTVPTSMGLWASWLPFSLPQRWPYCWWVAVVLDHYSRRIMGLAIFTRQPDSLAVRTFLGRTIRQAGARPRYLITDQGKQFTDETFRGWSRRRGIRQRFGAIGKYGSIAVIERLMRTLKQECTRRLLVPYSKPSFREELRHFSTWYNDIRPHDTLRAATPDEVYRGVPPACMQPRFEPRAKWPRHSPCAAPLVKIRGRPGARLDLHVSYVAGRQHLPVIALQRVA